MFLDWCVPYNDRRESSSDLFMGIILSTFTATGKGDDGYIISIIYFILLLLYTIMKSNGFSRCGGHTRGSYIEFFTMKAQQLNFQEWLYLL